MSQPATRIPILKLVLPTPFAVGDVNAYLLRGPRNVLIDTGPETDECWEALRSGLGSEGLLPEDVHVVLITHGHEDHYGLSARLADLGAEVLFPATDVPTRRTPEIVAFYDRELHQAGIPEDVCQEVGGNFRKLSRYGSLPSRYGTVRPGDEIPLSERHALRVLATPGHTPGHIAYYLASQQTLFAGDTIIANITPNPILSPDPDAPDRRFPGLSRYLDTLERLATLPIQCVHSGHRADLAAVQPYWQKARDFHASRQHRILALLSGKPPQSAYQVARALFANAIRLNVFLVISETVAHLDVLEAQGRVAFELTDGVRWYTASA